MAETSIIVIGAGIAGLSAGCYGQLNGYRTKLFESHNLPGGLCTAWKRQGYTFDGCLHWLVGTKPGSSFSRVWEELGALKECSIVDQEEFARVEGPDGKALIIYSDANRLEDHLKELSPQDGAMISEFADAVRRLSRFEMQVDKPRELFSVIDTLRTVPAILPVMGDIRKYRHLTLLEFASRFSDPFLRQMFPNVLRMPGFSTLALIFTLGFMHIRNAGFPIGGSLPFSHSIARRYLELGGEIHYKSRVEEILVENDRAIGVRLADGQEHRADIVISAADGHATIFEMLGGDYVNDEIRGYYEHMPIFEPLIQVSLGVARDLSDVPHSLNILLEKPASIGGDLQHWMGVRNFCYDDSLAPRGKSVVEVTFPSNYKYWKGLNYHSERYEAEKQQIARTVIALLENRFPGISRQVEVVDVATPLTYERYTGNWQGSFEGWYLTTEVMNRLISGKAMSKTLPGLDNFYMVGQWVEPGGGVPTSAKSGRDVIQIICSKDRRPFTTQTPVTRNAAQPLAR